MKKNTVRFYVTITIVKIATKILKLLGRNATHLPGWMANKLCPDFLGHLEKPERLVYITGTNGKTTVSNLTAEVFQRAVFLENPDVNWRCWKWMNVILR